MTVGPQNVHSVQAYAATYSNGSWGNPVLMDSRVSSVAGMNSTVSGLSCASITFCAAVTESGQAVTYSNGTWRKPVELDGLGLDSVSCPSTKFCIADDQNRYAVTYSSGTWGKPVQFEHAGVNYVGGGVVDSSSVSCGSPTFCVAFDGADGYAVTYSNGSWGTPNDVMPGVAVNAVSCPSSTFCAAVGGGDGAGYAVAYSNGTWGKPVQIGRNGAIADNVWASVSCASAEFCVAGNIAENAQNGESVTYSNGAWGSPTPNAIMLTVSCPSNTFCAATDGQSKLAIFEG
jgi:hypothetical protein